MKSEWDSVQVNTYKIAFKKIDDRELFVMI